MGANSTKLTKPYNHCKQNCWDRIKNELRRGLIEEPRMIKKGSMLHDNPNNFHNQLYKTNKTLTIGCLNCDLKCNNCMYIEVKWESDNMYNVSIWADSSKKKDLGGKGFMHTTKQVYDYIEKVYQQVK